MYSRWTTLTLAVSLGAVLACGETDSNEPRDPTTSGGGGSTAMIVCHSGPNDNAINPVNVRFQVQGTNGSFVDHCDASGKLVSYGCGSMRYCTPTEQNTCPGDLGVTYATGAVSEAIIDCPCSDGACPAP
jgi:hypothetical protein